MATTHSDHSRTSTATGGEEITISAELVRETANAWLLNCEGDEVWMPKSQVRFRIADKSVTLPRWLKEKFPKG